MHFLTKTQEHHTQSLPSACSLTSQTSVKQGRSTAFYWSSGTNFATHFHFSASSPFEVLSITNDHRPHEGCRLTHTDRHPLRHRLEHIHTLDIHTQTDTLRYKQTQKHTHTHTHTHTYTHSCRFKSKRSYFCARFFSPLLRLMHN